MNRIPGWLKWTGLLFLGLCLAYALFGASSHRRLERAYAALAAAGRPMTMEEIVPPPLEDQHNAALDYEAAFHLLATAHGPDADTYWNDLRTVASDFLDQPATPDETAALRNLLDHLPLQQAMARMRAGAAKPGCRYDLDYTAGANMLLPNLSDSRDITRILCAHARLQVQDGDSAGAWNTLALALRMGQAHRDEPILISQLVRIAQVQIIMETIHTLAAAAPPDADLAAQLQAEVANFEDKQPLVRSFDGERLLMGEWAFNLPLQELARMGGMYSAPMPQPGHIALALGGPVIHPLRKRDHAAYLHLLQAQTRTVAAPYAKGAAARIDAMIRDIPRYCIFTRMLLPALARAEKRFLEMIAQARLTRLGLALLQHRREHGTYPKSIQELQLQGSSEDPFSGKPLFYRITEDGFLLFSVGADGVDGAGSRIGDDVFWNHPALPEPHDPPTTSPTTP